MSSTLRFYLSPNFYQTETGIAEAVAAILWTTKRIGVPFLAEKVYNLAASVV